MTTSGRLILAKSDQTASEESKFGPVKSIDVSVNLQRDGQMTRHRVLYNMCIVVSDGRERR